VIETCLLFMIWFPGTHYTTSVLFSDCT